MIAALSAFAPIVERSPEVAGLVRGQVAAVKPVNLASVGPGGENFALGFDMGRFDDRGLVRWWG